MEEHIARQWWHHASGDLPSCCGPSDGTLTGMCKPLATLETLAELDDPFPPMPLLTQCYCQ